jgi:hypothetical protein
MHTVADRSQGRLIATKEEVIASQKRRIAELEAMLQAKEPPERGEARRQDNVIHVQFRR